MSNTPEPTSAPPPAAKSSFPVDALYHAPKPLLSLPEAPSAPPPAAKSSFPVDALYHAPKPLLSLPEVHRRNEYAASSYDIQSAQWMHVSELSCHKHLSHCM